VGGFRPSIAKKEPKTGIFRVGTIRATRVFQAVSFAASNDHNDRKTLENET